MLGFFCFVLGFFCFVLGFFYFVLGFFCFHFFLRHGRGVHLIIVALDNIVIIALDNIVIFFHLRISSLSVDFRLTYVSVFQGSP